MIKLKNLLKENQEITPLPTYVKDLEMGTYQFSVKTRSHGEIDIDTLDDVDVTEQDITNDGDIAIYRWLSGKYDGFGQIIQLRSAIKKS